MTESADTAETIPPADEVTASASAPPPADPPVPGSVPPEDEAPPAPEPLEAIALDGADIGAPYSVQAVPPSLREGHAMPPFAFSMASGQLPSGLSLAPGGLINGTPDSVGENEFEVQAHDANGIAHRGMFSISVHGPAPADETAAS